MSSLPSGPISLLLVEDVPEDARLMAEALKDILPADQLVITSSGEDALDYLFARGAWSGRDPLQQPRLVMLDLSLPRLGGLEVLSQIRANALTRILPVVIVSATSHQRDIRSAAQLGANSFVRKSLDFVRFSETLGLLARYWLELNIPPPRPLPER